MIKIQQQNIFEIVLLTICFFLVFKNFELTTNESTAYQVGEIIGKMCRALFFFLTARFWLNRLNTQKLL